VKKWARIEKWGGTEKSRGTSNLRRKGGTAKSRQKKLIRAGLPFRIKSGRGGGGQEDQTAQPSGGRRTDGNGSKKLTAAL